MINDRTNLKSRLQRLNPDQTPIENRKKVSNEELKDIIVDLQKGNTTSAIITSNDYIKKIDNKNIIYLNNNENEKEKINELSKSEELSYLVIKNINQYNTETQHSFASMIKDRTFMNYKIKNNTVIIFTIENKEDLKNISDELFHLCINAI